MPLFGQQFDEKDPRVIIEKVRIYQLTKELDLTSAQAEQFFPKLHELRKVEETLRERRMTLLSELRNLVHSEASNQDILETIKQYEAAHIKQIEQEVEHMKEIESILTPMQQAKFLIFEEDFMRDLLRMIKAVKEHRR
jgi:Spy/CpxP family protein refolding chaperone